MSWYKTPIQPIDPVVVSQQPKPPFRYIRDNFQGTGQNSHDIPPAQAQEMWQRLVNIQPITKGVLERRWGYVTNGAWANLMTRLYNFQSDSLGTRALIGCGPALVQALNEQGTVLYNGGIFNPISSSTIRSLTSRNYQYFINGNVTLTNHRTGDSLKWNGQGGTGVVGGTSNIGIVNTDVTINNSGGGTVGNTAGPSTGTVAGSNGSGTYSWTNPPGEFSGSFVNPAQVIFNWNGASGTQNTNNLSATGFFSSVTGSVVQGIQITYTFKVVRNPNGDHIPSPNYTLNAQLLKNGVPVGSPKSINGFDSGGISGGTFLVNLGGTNDLWGTTVLASDLTSNSFGLQISITGQAFAGPSHFITTFGTSLVQMTVTFQGVTSSTTSSGTGVGTLSSQTGGSVNLTIGRIYYLVGNNSSTGHFSDLSLASSSTGPITNQEFNLILATYNDPQVDQKYVLATADGGDPSILYETQVLIPGLTVSSWAINGSNQVTFTGTFTGSPPANTTTVVVGGLNHGAYLNNQTLTVTGTTGTTLTANFTHAADSATEIGVVGNYGFAIPNSVTLVVDNNPDPNLVTNQPLVFTDQFGTTYGLALNSPPPAGTLITKHAGRLWMAGVSGATHSVFFSKSISELTLPNGFIAGKYEEAWPASNYFDVSDGAESVTGFLSDGQTLYIGTQSHIRRLLGSSTANFTQPQIVHPQTGLINQESWQLVFSQGSPSGSCWLTPDFRVMQSDFNTYVDIGAPIQDVLNTIQPQAQSLAHAMFVSSGEYELYILAVPITATTFCDTHLVFDLRHRTWFIWQPATGSLSFLFNINASGQAQWLFIDQTQVLNQVYQSAAATDNGTLIPVRATTSWLHLGEPTRRKTLTEVQVFGNTTTLLTLNAANNQQDFALNTAGSTVVNQRALRQSPFGTWTTYLAGEECHHKYYQFDFTAGSSQPVFVSSYSISAIPLDDVA